LKLKSPDYQDSSNNDVEFVTFAPYFQENTTSATAPLAPTWMPNTNLSPAGMILACDGVFNSLDPFTSFNPSPTQLGEWQTALAGLQNSIVSAFNRGIATDFPVYNSNPPHQLIGGIAPNDWANPPLVTGASSLIHGTLQPNKTYYYVVTGLTPTGETTISREVKATTTSTNKRIQLSWTPQDTPVYNPVGYSGYKIYRSETPGSGYQLINWPVTNNHANNLTGFIDNGAMPMVAGTPPMYYQEGTAANWYAAFVHLNGSTNPISGVSVAGLGYGFAYDDQGNNSSDFTAYSPTGIAINLLSWTNRTTVPTQPTTNPLPAPPTTPNSLYFYRQPANVKVNSSNSVAFKAFTSADYTYFGGASLLVTLVGPNQQQTSLGTVSTDPMSGLGIKPFKAPSKAGTYYLLFTATDGSGKTYQTNPFQISPATAR